MYSNSLGLCIHTSVWCVVRLTDKVMQPLFTHKYGTINLLFTWCGWLVFMITDFMYHAIKIISAKDIFLPKEADTKEIIYLSLPNGSVMFSPRIVWNTIFCILFLDFSTFMLHFPWPHGSFFKSWQNLKHYTALRVLCAKHKNVFLHHTKQYWYS